jgi:hypothetical protein
MMRSWMVPVMWTLFPRPRRDWQRAAYLAGARQVAGLAEWVHYRAEEWCLELEAADNSDNGYSVKHRLFAGMARAS